jgi:hypothetical protein
VANTNNAAPPPSAPAPAPAPASGQSYGIVYSNGGASAAGNGAPYGNGGNGQAYGNGGNAQAYGNGGNAQAYGNGGNAPVYGNGPAPTYGNSAPPSGAVYGNAAPPTYNGSAPAAGGTRGYAGDPAPATGAAPSAAAYPARVPGVIYSSNGGVYPPPPTPIPSGSNAGAGAATYTDERPSNLPPGGRTNASYDAPDTNPPPAPGAAAGPVSSIHLDELMSLHEWESSGVSRLRPQEIAVLEKWIERYRQNVADSVTRTLQTPPRAANPVAAAPLPPISRAADGTPKNAHAVTAIAAGSRYVTLDDGSVWDVYTSDQTETAAWQRGDLVQVRVAPVAYGEFDHELVNNQRTGPVRAKFTGYAARQ